MNKRVALVEAAGRKIMALPGAITDEAWYRQIVTETLVRLGSLNILETNAGHQQSRESIDKLTSKDFDRSWRPTSTSCTGSRRRPCRTCR